MTQDLSAVHELINDLFPKPASKADLDRYRLTKEQVEFFYEYGYLSGVKILEEKQVEILREQLADLFTPDHDGHELWHEYHSNESGDPNSVLFHALGGWRIKPAFHDALWNPAFTVPASQLLGGSVRFWHDQLFCKPAHHGGVVAWHQDYSYWTRTGPMAHLTCWIGLDDSTLENGCLQYIPSSHRWQLLPVTGLANNMDAIQTVLNDEQKAAFKPVPVELKAGCGSFHHPLMVHGSYENRSGRSRRAMVINAFKDGTVSNADESLLKGVPAIAKGQAMGGQFFPLLLEA